VGFLGWRGVPGASEEGGLEALPEFWLSRASSSATRAVSASHLRHQPGDDLIARRHLRFQLRDARVSGIHLHHQGKPMGRVNARPDARESTGLSD